MNVEQLKSLIDKLLEDEASNNLQSHVGNLNNALQNLSANPQNAESQINVNNSIKTLSEKFLQTSTYKNTSDNERLIEIGGSEYFSSDVIGYVTELMMANQITPAVVYTEFSKYFKNRQLYINALQNTSKSLDLLGIKSDKIDPGTAKIGFKLPRDMYDNNLDGLIKELSELRLIIRAFSEIATGSVDGIVLGEISTTNPLFFFKLHPKTIAYIGGAITWALITWQHVEEIKKVRAETKLIEAKTSVKMKKVDDGFDDAIKEIINKSIDDKANELLGERSGDRHRTEELGIHIKYALKSILARVERGMTVEIKFLPPTIQETQGDSTEDTQLEPEEFLSLREIAPRLSFPMPDPLPITTLPYFSARDEQIGEENAPASGGEKTKSKR